MAEIYVALNQTVATNDNTGLSFASPWEVRDLSTGNLITNSGLLHTFTLNATILAVIQAYQNRQGDYSFTLNNSIVAILHPNDTYDETFSP